MDISSRRAGGNDRFDLRFLVAQNFKTMFGKSLPVSATVLLGLLVGFAASQQPQVMVEQGALFGMTETFMEDEFIGVTKSINVFKGVPFAEPPVGPLRFAAPMMKAGWGEGVWNATYFRDACIQYNIDTRFTLPTGEDCLYLNIYAPTPAPAEGLPVMVWFHGGGFTAGSANVGIFNGMPLAALGDVIVVTVNSRLGLFGYMSTGDEVVPGNAGLKDQVMALKWVNANIAAFGGSSDRVTIFGQGTGSEAVNLMMLSDMATGLFNQAIMQSGAAFWPWRTQSLRPLLKREAFTVGQAFGCMGEESSTLVSCLREVEATELLAKAVEFKVSTFYVDDGEFLEAMPAELYASGKFNPAKVLMGTNADDGSILILDNPFFASYFLSETPPFISLEDLESGLAEQLQNYIGQSDNEHLQKAIRAMYLDFTKFDNETANFFETAVRFDTDFFFACPTNKVARYHAGAGGDVFMYEMTHKPSASIWDVGEYGPGWLGATYAEEIMYMFGVPFGPASEHFTELQREEKEFSVKMMEFWTNFAKNGNPGVKRSGFPPESREDYWPKLTIPGLMYKDLNLNLTIGTGLKARECYFQNTYLVQLQTMIGALPDVEREWKQSYSTWKYEDMADWKKEFNQFKAINGRQ